MLSSPFSLPVYFHLAAAFLFGVTGALAALKRGYDVIGLFALAFATAFGGAMIRDGLFIQNGPPLITKDSRYILVIVAAGAVTLLFRSHVVRFNRWIAWIDALGLGAYAVIGVQLALNAGLSAASAVLVGVINAAGGSIARDVLSREEPLAFKPGQFYVLAAGVGCLVYIGLKLKMPSQNAAWIAIGVTFVLRVLAIQFNWKTNPVSLSLAETAKSSPRAETS